MLSNVKVIEGKNSTGFVGFGSEIEVMIDSQKQTFKIVGKNEADPLSGKISAESPLGKALMGKKAGESAILETVEGKAEYKIIATR